MEVQRLVWFQEPGGDESMSQVLPSPSHILKAHRQFKKKLRKTLHIGNREVHIASTKKELDKQIEEARSGHSPRLLAQQNLDDASMSVEIYTNNRRHGVKKVGRVAQEFTNAFSQFITAYSGIIDVVKTAGGPYGEVAYQTLSILLIVAVNKNTSDTMIREMLDDIRKSLPRLENWPEIYPTETMRILVAGAYEQVMEFSRAASEYFTRFWTRFATALLPPASSTVNKVATVIHQTLAEINSEALYRLHGRTQSIETRVVRSGQTIEQLKAQVISSNEKLKNLQVHAERMEANNDLLQQALQEQKDKFEAYRKDVELRAQQEDEQRLKSLEEDLGVTFPSTETNIDETKQVLMKTFPNAPHYVRNLPSSRYVQMSRSLLQNTECYRSWITSTESCMLFLSGRTAYEGKIYPGWNHSWLSPAAIYITEDLAHEDIPVSFFSCHPGMEYKLVPTKQIIASIVLQILKRKPYILREKAVQFHGAALSGALSDPDKNWGNAKTQARALIKLLGDVLAAVKDLGVTFIVLDRLDQCEGKFNVVMDELVRLVGNPACNVKLVVIAETSIGGGEWHPEYLREGEYRLDRVFRYQDWNQSRLSPLEVIGERPLTWTSESSTLTREESALTG